MFCRPFEREIFVWLALASCVAPLAAAEVKPGAGAEQPYRVTRWTAENGLPQNKINALAQTRDGYLWLGTLKGLARFDGVKFKVFDQSNTPQMTHEAINDLAVDAKEDGLWVSTGAGLFYYRDHHFERFGPEDGIPGPVGSLQAARDGGVWFSPRPGETALARDGRVRRWEFGPEREQNIVYQLGELSPSELLVLIGTVGGSVAIHRLNLNTKVLVPLHVPPGASRFATNCASFLQNADASFWLCTGQGLWRGSEKGWTQITSSNAESKAWPQRIYQSSDAQVWVTQFEVNRISLQRLVQGQLEPFAAPEWPTELNVTRVMEDREGDLWVGTTTGLFRLERKRIKVYSRLDGLRSDNTLGVTKGADGTIWVSTAEGMSRIRDGQVENLPLPEGSENWKRIGVLLADQQDALWVGWPGPDLVRFQAGKWQMYRAPQRIANSGELGAIYEDRKGRIWMGTGNDVFYKEGNQWTVFSTTNGLSHRDVRVIYQDRRGDLWFGTFGGGLNHLQDGKFTAYQTSRGERNNRAWWIHEDADGVFWVGSEDGLNRFVPPAVGDDVRGLASKGSKQKAESGNEQRLLTSAPTRENAGAGRFFTFTTEQGLGENVVNNIQEDDFGYLWLSGLRGIYRVSRQELNDVAARKRAQVRCVAYGEADGMLSSECNGGDNQPAGCKDAAGRIWFPTAQGVVVIDPQEMRRTETPPPVVIEQVRANEEIVFGDGAPADSKGQRPKSEVGDGIGPSPQLSTLNHQLAPGHARVLEIHYTANTLVAPERVRFKYRLEGHDSDWLPDDQNRRVAFYTSLRPGHYTFHVKACNNHGYWNETGAALAFYLAPHFYQTWTFYVLCAGAVIGMGWSLHFLRLKVVHKMQKLHEAAALADQRARLAQDMHDDIGASLTKIALLSEVARKSAHEPAVAEAQSQKISTIAGEVVNNLSELIWATNPKFDTLENFAAYLREYVAGYLEPTSMRWHLKFPATVPSQHLTSEFRRSLFLVVKEALHNIIKHSAATQVEVGLMAGATELQLWITDNGKGFLAEDTSPLGDGLLNMRQRVTALGGCFDLQSPPLKGTKITITVPLSNESIRVT